MRFDGKTALVTGAASGIGRATALALGRGGAHVCVTDIDEAGAEAVAAEVAALVEGEPRKLAAAPTMPVRLDVTEESDWEDAIDAALGRWDRLDVLVANAGITDGTPITQTDFDAWRRVMAVNLDGAFLGIKHGARAMATGGSIVVVGSASGIRAAPGAAAYSASKSAVAMLVRVAALELARQDIRVNAVSPSAVRTPMWNAMPFFRELVAERGEADAWREVAQGTPMRRVAEPEEVARAITFLASDEASYITGVELPVDGGYTLG